MSADATVHVRQPGPSFVASDLACKSATTTNAQNDIANLSHTLAIDKELSRRRSVDVGGLALALGSAPLGEESSGKGWGGWDEDGDGEAHFAELLGDMFTQIQSIINVPVLSSPSKVSEDTRRRLIGALDSWNFEPHKLPDDEVLASALILFEVLFRIDGLQEEIDVSLEQLDNFLRHLRQVYRSMNTYHNFQHALDVFQATHMFLRTAGLVPPVSILLSKHKRTWKPDKGRNHSLVSLLTKEDLFALYIAAVGHDVGHPGFNNMFMKNAGAPLSQVYDHKSALEQMHCAFLIPIMKQHGLGHLLEQGNTATPFRKLLFETVLATDMGVHGQFMQRFKALVDYPPSYDLPETRLLLCQALIKCADISNPSRPHSVSKHWSAALNAEWASQALLEKQLQLPISVQDSTDPVDEAKGQIFFIQAFVLPLLEITTHAIPEMIIFTEQCTANAVLWKQRLTELKSKSQSTYPPVPYRSVSPPHPLDYISVLPLSLPVEFFPPELYSTPPHSVSSTTTATPSLGSRSSSPELNGHESRTSFRTFPTITTTSLAANSPSIVSPSDLTNLSSPLSPRTESLPRTPGGAVSPPVSSIRAAYRDSVRRKKEFHRSSWTGSSSSSMSFSLSPSPLTPNSSMSHQRSPTTPGSSISPAEVSVMSPLNGTSKTTSTHDAQAQTSP
ncbi:HD-domain/PDEase-like protein [Rickenella mellea]|uniref:Phosphodiesterase n=1 Tax=Rickenella mellea TaxID=50990 RepID=A0A4Y7QE56_9AGAM|nr:HD-domain/PDEase-like protein [Rickenella mellea]